MKRRGAVYIATGNKYYEEAKESAKSLIKFNDIDVTIVTDLDEIDYNIFDNKVDIGKSYGDVRDKIYNLKHKYYDKFLFIDSDTLVTGSIMDIFDLLENFDMAIAVAPVNPVFRIDDIPEFFPEFNTGVIGLKYNSSVEKMMGKWVEFHKEQMRGEGGVEGTTIGTSPEKAPFGLKHDQPPFRRALYKSEVRYSVLTPEYNLRGDGARVYGDVKIIHSPQRKEICESGNLSGFGKRNLFGGSLVSSTSVGGKNNYTFIKRIFYKITNKIKNIF